MREQKYRTYLSFAALIFRIKGNFWECLCCFQFHFMNKFVWLVAFKACSHRILMSSKLQTYRFSHAFQANTSRGQSPYPSSGQSPGPYPGPPPNAGQIPAQQSNQPPGPPMPPQQYQYPQRYPTPPANQASQQSIGPQNHRQPYSQVSLIVF